MLKFFIFLNCLFFALVANAQYDSFMTIQENALGIPGHLLRAVSNVESGRSTGNGIAPWPWTINVEGKGYLFKTKQEAISAVEKFQRNGAKSIDVGIMQINLRHHPGAFRNLQEAFDPQLNIAYGAKFLKQLFLQHKSWNLAVGHYHSATPKFHNAYKQRVLSNWMQLTSNKKSGDAQLKQTVMNFDSVTDIKDVGEKVTPKANIRPFAKVKRSYYSLDGSTPAQSINSDKQKYVLENAASKQYYSLD